MKFLVIGHGRHGKDTVSEFLQKYGGYSFVSSSEFAAHKVLYPTMEDEYNCWWDCFKDRHNHRGHWFKTIAEYCKEDPSRLTQEILGQYDIYCGMRNRVELEASRHLFDLVIWVERPNTPNEDPQSISVMRSDADIVIYNDGDLRDLEIKVYNLLRLKGECRV